MWCKHLGRTVSLWVPAALGQMPGPHSRGGGRVAGRARLLRWFFVYKLWVLSLNPPLRWGKKRHKRFKKRAAKGQKDTPAEGERTGHAAFREASVYIKDPRPASASPSKELFSKSVNKRKMP